MRIPILAAALFSLIALSASAEPTLKITVAKRTVKEFAPGRDCGKTRSCSLKKFKLVEMKKKLSWSDKDYDQRLTDIRAVYETDTVENLEQFVIVQFIRGCYYETTPDSKKQTLGYAREYFGKLISYKHDHWQVDSVDEDPAYNSDAKLGRFAYLKWNKNPRSYDANNPRYYFQEKPKHPVVFVSDIPGVAAAIFEESGEPRKAVNSSLEFKTCIYRADSVPTKTDPEGKSADGPTLKPEQAIACHEWDHKFAYDFDTGKFVEGGAITPFCLKETRVSPATGLGEMVIPAD